MTIAVAWRLLVGVLIVAASAVTIDRLAGPEEPGSFGTLTAPVRESDRDRADAARAVQVAFDELIKTGDSGDIDGFLGWVHGPDTTIPPRSEQLAERGLLATRTVAELDEDVAIYAMRCGERIAVLVQSRVVPEQTDLDLWTVNECPSPWASERFVVMTTGTAPSP